MTYATARLKGSALGVSAPTKAACNMCKGATSPAEGHEAESKPVHNELENEHKQTFVERSC